MNLSNTFRILKKHLPKKAIRILIFFYRKYIFIFVWYIGLWDHRNIRKTGFKHIPPASLRYRVHGSPEIDSFLNMGKLCSQEIEKAILSTGKNFNSFQHVLDFGVGCGRTIIWFANHSKSTKFYGTDIDSDSIYWCKTNLDFADFKVNKSQPPLEYPSDFFDLIYAVSVFTHLNEDYQFRWLKELKRIAKPGAILIITLHGRYYLENKLDEESAEKMEKEGFVFIPSQVWKDIFPDWYQTAYHSDKYVEKNFTKFFDILNYIPGRLPQDIIILQKPQDDGRSCTGMLLSCS